MRVSGGGMELGSERRLAGARCADTHAKKLHTRVPLFTFCRGVRVCVWSLAASLSLTLDSTTPLSSSRRGLSFSRLAAGSTYMALGTGIWGLTAPRPWLVAGGWRRLPGPGPARAPPRAPRGRREAEGARARARVCAYMFVWWGCPSPAARCAA